MNDVHGSDEEGGALDARLYDLIHRGNPGDVAVYRSACRGARDVLELGCGTGRILRALSSDGVEVVGVDRDRGRLELARERLPSLDPAARARIRLVHADIVGLRLGRTFDRVVAPYNLLYAFVDPGDLGEALETVRCHLAPGGRFVFDGYLLNPDIVPESGGTHGPPVPLATVQDGDATVRIFEQDEWQPSARRVDVVYTFHVHAPGRGVVVRRQRVRHRWFPAEEVHALLEGAGLRPVEEPTVRGPEGARWYTVVAEHAPRG